MQPVLSLSVLGLTKTQDHRAGASEPSLGQVPVMESYMGLERLSWPLLLLLADWQPSQRVEMSGDNWTLRRLSMMGMMDSYHSGQEDARPAWATE